jgi:hypothetical protein
MDQKQMDEMLLKVKEYDPRSPKVKHVYLVWREERYESSSMIGVCIDTEVAKVHADNHARRWDFKLRSWKIENDGIDDYLSAAVDGPLSTDDEDQRVHYTIRKEPVLREPDEFKPLMKDQRPDSKYGILCRTCGPQGLTYENYMDQLAAADSLWACPVCRQSADFDECRYEAQS